MHPFATAGEMFSSWTEAFCPSAGSESRCRARWTADAAAPLRFEGLRGRLAQTDRWKWHLDRLVRADQALADSFAGQRPKKFGKPSLLPSARVGAEQVGGGAAQGGGEPDCAQSRR